MRMSFQELQEGGFVRNQNQNGSHRARGRKASRSTEPKIFKTYDDHVAEEKTARQRWAGIPPIVAAREMIAEANLPEDTITKLSATVVELNETGELEPMILSGKLADALAELATGV